MKRIVEIEEEKRMKINDKTLKRIGIMGVCLLIISVNLGGACATSINDNNIRSDVKSVNATRLDNVTNMTDKVGKTRNNYSSREYNDVRGKLIEEIPENHAFEWDNPITNKNGHLYFSRTHCLGGDPDVLIPDAIGALENWLLKNKALLGSDFTFTKQNIYDLIRPIIHEYDIEAFTQWRDGKFEYYNHSQARKLERSEIRIKFMNDVYNYCNNDPQHNSPFYVCGIEGHKSLTFTDYTSTDTTLRRTVCLAMDWMMANNVPTEMFSMNDIRALVTSCLEFRRQRALMDSYDFSWRED